MSASVHNLDKNDLRRLHADLEIAAANAGIALPVGLRGWLLHGNPPGSFTRAVLDNNLSEAAHRADAYNAQNLATIARVVFSVLPSSGIAEFRAAVEAAHAAPNSR